MSRPKLIDAIMPDKVERLSRDLDEANREHQGLQDEIGRLQAIVAASEDAEEIMRAEAQVRAKSNRSKKIRVRMATLSSQLDLAKSAERRKLRTVLLADVQGAGADLIAAARKLDIGPYMRAIEALRANGFNLEEYHAPKPPVIGRSLLTAPDVIDRFEAGLQRLREREEGAPEPSTIKRATPVVVAPAAAQPKEASPDQQPEVTQKPARRPLHAEAPQKGKVLIRYLRHSVQLPDGSLSLPGDVLNVDSRVAERLIANSAAVPVEQVEAI